MKYEITICFPFPVSHSLYNPLVWGKHHGSNEFPSTPIPSHHSEPSETLPSSSNLTVLASMSASSFSFLSSSLECLASALPPAPISTQREAPKESAWMSLEWPEDRTCKPGPLSCLPLPVETDGQSKSPPFSKWLLGVLLATWAQEANKRQGLLPGRCQ